MKNKTKPSLEATLINFYKSIDYYSLLINFNYDYKTIWY